jgi:hypothetical protein
MTMRFKIYLLILLSYGLSFMPAQAQENNIETGTWRYHPVFSNVGRLTDAGPYVYAYDANCFYRWDKSSKELEILNKANLLSDVNATAVGYDSVTRKLVIAYESGLVDLIDPNDDKTSIFSIRNSPSITGSKLANNVFCRKGVAYVSAEYGLLEIDLRSGNVLSVYQNIGPNSTQVAVYHSIIREDDTIICSTAQGLIASSIKRTTNRLDFNQWLRYSGSNGLPLETVREITLHNGFAFAMPTNGDLYRLSGGQWIKISNQKLAGSLKRLKSVSSSTLAAVQNQNIFLYDFNANKWDTLQATNGQLTNDIIQSGNRWYIGTNFFGVLELDLNGQKLSEINPNSPFFSNPFYLYHYENNLLLLSGSYSGILGTQLDNRDGIALFNNQFWSNYSTNKGTAFDLSGNPYTLEDPVRAAYSPQNGQLYVATWGTGIVRVDPNFRFNQIDGFTTKMVSSQPIGHPLYSVFFRMSCLEFDEAGFLWSFNYSFGAGIADNYLHKFKLKPNGDIDSAASVRYTFQESWRSVDLVIDDFGNKWMRQQGDNILVFKDTGQSGFQVKILSDQINQGGLPNKTVRAVAKDLQGDIWVGTGDGVAVFFNGTNVMRSNTVNASLPVFEQRPLLNDQFITAIAVDGGNRKWIGTSSGVFLVNDDGSKLIRQFTEKNSPLPSDDIRQISINQQSGEVFFLTAKGLASYRSDATLSEKDAECDKIKVFPNPVVRSRGHSQVTISGLQQDASVKITDVSGKLFYEGIAQGGTYSWNLLNYNNEAANAGVYLILSGPEAEGKGCASKKIVLVD